MQHILISGLLLLSLSVSGQDSLNVRYVKAGLAIPTVATPIRVVPSVLVQRVFSARNWLSYGVSDFIFQRTQGANQDISMVQVLSLRLQYDRYLWSGGPVGVYVLGGADARELVADFRPGTPTRFRSRFVEVGTRIYTGAGIRWCRGRWLVEAEVPVLWLSTDMNIIRTDNPAIPVRQQQTIAWDREAHYNLTPRIGVGFRLAS